MESPGQNVVYLFWKNPFGRNGENIFSGSFRNAWTIIGNRKAELAVCLLAGLCFLYGLREFISIPGENSLSVFLEGSYPDQDRAEEILKTVRKQENKTDICFYWDGGFMKAEELFGTENAAGKNPFF